MKKCVFCGTESPDDAVFCELCGRRFGTDSEDQAVVVQKDNEESSDAIERRTDMKQEPIKTNYPANKGVSTASQYGMIEETKLKAFIRSLNDEEIASQLGDLFAFTEMYKRFLTEEQSVRRYNPVLPPVNEIKPITEDLIETENTQTYQEFSTENESDETETEMPVVESNLDYNTLTAIHAKVSNFSVDELLDNMKELDEILSKGSGFMPPNMFEEYCVAREYCEIRYVDDYFCEPILCENCGAYSLPGEIYCRKCGTKQAQQ